MPMYNLLDNSDSHSKTSGRLRNYYGDKVNSNGNENNADNYKINNNKIIT